MNTLPNELLIIIFSHLSKHDLIRLSSVNHQFLALGRTDSLWRSLTHHDFDHYVQPSWYETYKIYHKFSTVYILQETSDQRTVVNIYGTYRSIKAAISGLIDRVLQFENFEFFGDYIDITKYSEDKVSKPGSFTRAKFIDELTVAIMKIMVTQEDYSICIDISSRYYIVPHHINS